MTPTDPSPVQLEQRRLKRSMEQLQITSAEKYQRIRNALHEDNDLLLQMGTHPRKAAERMRYLANMLVLSATALEQLAEERIAYAKTERDSSSSKGVGETGGMLQPPDIRSPKDGKDKTRSNDC